MIYRTEILDAIANSVAFLVADLETGEIVAASPVCERLFGYHVLGELTGRNVDELVPVPVRESHTANRAAYAANPVARPMGAALNLEGQRRNGTTFPVRISLQSAVVGTRRCVIAVIVSMDTGDGWHG